MRRSCPSRRLATLGRGSFSCAQHFAAFHLDSPTLILALERRSLCPTPCGVPPRFTPCVFCCVCRRERAQHLAAFHLDSPLRRRHGGVGGKCPTPCGVPVHLARAGRGRGGASRGVPNTLRRSCPSRNLCYGLCQPGGVVCPTPCGVPVHLALWRQRGGIVASVPNTLRRSTFHAAVPPEGRVTVLLCPTPCGVPPRFREARNLGRLSHSCPTPHSVLPRFTRG